MRLKNLFTKAEPANDQPMSEAEARAAAEIRMQQAAEEMTAAWEEAKNAGLRMRPWIRWADNTIVLTAAAHKTVYDPAQVVA